MTLALSVTDDQLGRYFRRMVAIAERGGKSLQFDKLMDTLQVIHDGKLTPFAGGLRGSFVRTMPILIGGVKENDLAEQVKTAGRELGPHAASMMRHELFTTLAEQEPCLLIDLSPADLGFTEEPTTTELLDSERLLKWSATNLDDGWVIELCPVEVGPHLAIQYKDQPKGEVLWVAMERIPDSVGDPNVFNVERNDDGKLWLNNDWANPDNRWNLDNRIVFRLRNSLHFSPRFGGAEFFVSWPFHPPSILPTSSVASEIAIYFLASSDFVSHRIMSNNFNASTFRVYRPRRSIWVGLKQGVILLPLVEKASFSLCVGACACS